jgi:hypothetical protein
VLGSHKNKKILEEIREGVAWCIETTRCIHEDVKRLLRWIALRKIHIKQIGGHGMNFSIVAGTTGSFAAVLSPPNGAQAPGTVPQWSASDPSVTLNPSTDGLTCDASVPLSDTAASFDLKVSAVSSDPAVGTVSSTHTITVTQPTVALQAIDFTQTAG